VWVYLRELENQYICQFVKLNVLREGIRDMYEFGAFSKGLTNAVYRGRFNIILKK
jgi:hypothetical protein